MSVVYFHVISNQIKTNAGYPPLHSIQRQLELHQDNI